MKSERRHELQQNDLLAWIFGAGEQMKPYATLVMLLIILAVVAVGGWKWWNRQSATSAAYAWDDLLGAINSGNPAVISQVADERPNTEVGHWAAVLAGDMYLESGCQQLFDSKATAAQDLRKAVDQYLIVRDTCRTPSIREQATFGLAKAYESLAGTRQSEGELDKAVQYYQEVASTWPDGVYADLSTRRLEDLQRQDTKEFYDKFAQFDPQPEYAPQSSGEANEPSFDLESLDEGSVPDHSEAMGAEDDSATVLELPTLGDEPAATGEGEAEETDSQATESPEPEAAAADEAAPDAEPADAESDK